MSEQTQVPPVLRSRTAAFKNPAYLQNSFSMLLFFASWGIWWSFFQIWLTNDSSGLGLNGTQVGTVYSVNSIGTLIIMFLYGTMQDRLGIRRQLVIGAAIVQSLIGPFAVFVYRPLLENNFMLGVVVGAVVLSAGFMSAVGLLEAVSERLSRRFGFEYGQARMWGSFGYAMVALVAGFLFNVNPALNFWFGSAFGVVSLLVLLLWKSPKTTASGELTSDSETSTPSFSEMVALLKVRELWVVILFVLFTWTFYTVFDQQMFPDFYTSLFATQERGQEIYGVLNSVQVFLEAIMMGLVPLLMRKIGVRNTLMLGILIMTLRILGCAIFSDPLVVSLIKMLHAPEVALCILPIFRYFTLHFNPLLSATLYMVGFQISAQVGNVILSPVLGSLRDTLGYQPTFFIISGIVALAGVYGYFFLKKDHEVVHGDPFYTDRQRATQASGQSKI